MWPLTMLFANRDILAGDASAFECVQHAILPGSNSNAAAAASAFAAASPYFSGPSLAGHPTGRHGGAPGGRISRMGSLSTVL